MAKMMTGGRICIIDDDEDICEILEILLSPHYTVRTFGDPHLALQQIDKAEFDLVMTDFHMPEMSGVEILRHIRTKWKELPVMIVSGSDPMEEEGRLLTLDPFVTTASKPFNDQSIRAAIELAMKRQAFRNAS